jgi:glycosyltransferase involved in cell wall biosynthesis
MKVLHTIRSVNPEGGGVFETVRQFSRAMAAQGHQVSIASLDAPDDPWVRACEEAVIALGPARGNYGYSPRFVPWLRERAREFDAVVVNGLWQFNSFGVWQALRGTGRPYVVFPHGMLDPWFKRQYPLKHAKKWLYWPWGEYRVLRDASAVLFTCEQERRLARESFWLYRCREQVVTLGIERPAGDAAAQRESFLNRFPQCRGRRLVLFLGRIHEKKGCDLLIRAFSESGAARGPETLLVMAGPEQQNASEWRQMARGLGIEDPVVWTGMLTGDLKWGALRAAEVFVLPSHQENFGIAVVEALACGTPVLISHEVNIWREIVEAGAGLAEPDTLAGTTDLLRRWFGMTASQQQRMGEAARVCFDKQFEIQRATELLLRVLTTLQGDAGARLPSTKAVSAIVPAVRI